MRILLIGSSGLLGTELKKLNHEMICPTHREFDISEWAHGKIKHFQPDIVINAAVVKDNRIIEQNPEEAIKTNIIGAAMLAATCAMEGIRYVYISTDYIFKGDRGNYKETDEILPFNLYAWSKLGGECSAVMVKNHLIIRTSFGPDQFDYKEAFIDKYSSKDYVSVIAPLIYEAAISPLTGVLNLGTERKSLYHYASQKSKVKAVSLKGSKHRSPYDTSLNTQKWIDHKGNNTAREHKTCRCCGSTDLVKYLDLGIMPLANNLESTSERARESERYPLQVLFCQSCGLSQLSVIIDPGKLFSYYTYRSGVNEAYKDHCYNMILSLRESYGPFAFHIDIAGNDGSLLAESQKVHQGIQVLNVDPAGNLTAIAEANGIKSLTEFWSPNLVPEILAKYGEADLITATNVFAHVDDIKSFLLACYHALKDEGILVIECPYIVDFIENVEFDTVYHEHLSYMSLLPVHRLCSKMGLKIIDVSKHAIRSMYCFTKSLRMMCTSSVHHNR